MDCECRVLSKTQAVQTSQGDSASVSRKAFTLIEMLIVLMISLAMMTIILPVFQVTSRTIQAVERKLAVYEAARNILDQIAFELRTAVMNEQGDGFAIKPRYVMDGDSATPYHGNSAKRFKGSRREVNSIYFSMLQPGGCRNNPLSFFPGSMSFPMAYPEHDMYYPEAWQASIWSSAINPWLQHGDDDAVASSLETLEVTSHYDALSNNVGVNSLPGYNEITTGNTRTFNDWQPGNEPMKYDFNDLLKTAIGRKKWRENSGVRIIDIEFAHWDNVRRKFIRYDGYYGIYFAPAPKAVQVTISACDINKRAFVTLSRIVNIPIGVGDGTVFPSWDFFWMVEPATGQNKGFNRVKVLDFLQPW
jgi:prepilin-type N-terminal cleavage/methylation domain-containing protein